MATSVGSGRIELILGNMYSGKSSEAFRRARRHQIAGKRVIVVKYGKDTRYSATECATHDGTTMPAISTGREITESLITKLIHDADVIVFDEIQFLCGIASACEQLANAGKIVIADGLDGDSRREQFGEVLKLIPIADDYQKYKAVCHFCGNDAAFTLRIVESGAQELIGGIEAYRAACRQCFLAKGSKSLSSS
jgi:thymidine kinase